MVYNKYLLITITIFIILIATYRVVKNMVLYRQFTFNPEKYRNFYAKLTSYLVDSNDLVSNIYVKSSNNIVLDTCFIQNKFSDMCIIFFHGEKGNLSMRFDMIKFLYGFGSVLIFDYRTYGKSTGNVIDLSALGLLDDANAIWDYVRNTLGYQSNKISLFGESLGCSVAIELASKLSKTLNNQYYPHSIILTSPVCSLASLLKSKFKNFNLDFLNLIIPYIETEYNTIDAIKYINYSIKIIIAHSQDNDYIPYSEGKTLYDSISNNHPNVKFIDIMGKNDGIGLTDDYIYSVSDILQD